MLVNMQRTYIENGNLAGSSYRGSRTEFISWENKYFIIKKVDLICTAYEA